MNEALPKNVLLPSELERRQIFYWLKKVSSVTAWRRIFHYYQIWATATESSLRLADESGWGEKTALPYASYASILNGLAHCEEGTIRLSKGDKRVFKFDANGEFEMAARALFHWKELINRIEEGENIIDQEHTPLWQEFCDAANAAYRVWDECSTSVLEPRYLDESAPLVYNDWLIGELNSEVNANAPEDISSPQIDIFISTDEYIPYSGIWEPIRADLKKNFWNGLIRHKGVPKAPFEISGTMNYLHAGSKAPQAPIETPTDFLEIKTTWRLLWKDDRYSDGLVPAEEANYRFRQPDKPIAHDKSPKQMDHIQWADTGAVVPTSGRWLLESDLRISSYFSAGDIFPEHQGRAVRWVLANY